MSRRVYSNGVLVEEWDDATLTYTKYDATGTVVTQRTYTASETAAIVGAGAVVITERQMVVLDDAGSEILRIGDMEWGDRGLTIRRERGGNAALEMKKAFSNSTKQSITIYGSGGETILTEESLGTGLGKPYLPIPLQPVTATSTTLTTGPWGPQVAVTSGTFVTTHQAWMPRQNQFGLFRIRIAASDTTTAGEVQVINPTTGFVLAPFFQPSWVGTRAAGSTGYTEVVTSGAIGLSLPGTVNSESSVAVQVRRTAGTGTLTVAVPSAHGWNA